MQRILIPHGLGDGTRCFYLDERPFADSRAPLRGLQPFPFVIHEFRPERKSAALQRFRRVDRTALRFQENALDLSGNTQTAQVFRAIDVAALENGRPDLQKGGEAENVVFSQVDKALLFATFYTSGLALKSQVSQV